MPTTTKYLINWWGFKIFIFLSTIIGSIILASQYYNKQLVNKNTKSCPKYADIWIFSLIGIVIILGFLYFLAIYIYTEIKTINEIELTRIGKIMDVLLFTLLISMTWVYVLVFIYPKFDTLAQNYNKCKSANAS